MSSGKDQCKHIGFLGLCYTCLRNRVDPCARVDTTKQKVNTTQTQLARLYSLRLISHELRTLQELATINGNDDVVDEEELLSWVFKHSQK